MPSIATRRELHQRQCHRVASFLLLGEVRFCEHNVVQEVKPVPVHGMPAGYVQAQWVDLLRGSVRWVRARRALNRHQREVTR